ncbi:MAG: DEAD/DEAH box helicase [Flaviflexus sp.]|nr:DEAD/DEAH box helicase [Flaviflexus sp.]
MDAWEAVLAEAGDLVAATHTLPARSGREGTWPDLHPRLAAGFSELGLSHPWKHQEEAFNSITSRRHTVIATGTGSGKSLAAWAPLLNRLATARKATSLAEIGASPTVLYLAPTKALAADQHASLARIISACELDLVAGAVDGDATAEERRAARARADVIISNPDFLHFRMLAQHRQWTRLFKGLSAIVIDEFHSYRGMTAAHVALVVRRALRVAAHYGASPTLVFLSATAKDPAGAAATFLNIDAAEISLIDQDASRASGARVAIVCPMPETSTIRQAAGVAATLIDRGAATLVFSRSRAGTEAVAEEIRQVLEERHSPHCQAVESYRGGYLPEERRELERELRAGRLRGLASTNALELGIDISGLDAVVCAGWPGTHASFRQQLGRAGRAARPGIGILLTRDDPLDQHYAEHADTIFDEPLEAQVFNPHNPYILQGHLLAAAAELPLTELDAPLFGLDGTELFSEIAAGGLLIERGGAWRWNVALGIEPHSLIDLRSASGEIAIVEQGTGQVIGTVNSERADSTVHPGAIYVHRGRLFSIAELGETTAIATPAEGRVRTRALSSTAVEIMTIEAERSLVRGTLGYGQVTVASQVTGYDLLTDTGQFLAHEPLDMPMRELNTAGCWWTVPLAACSAAGLTPDILPGALHGLEHCAIGLLPLFATCDRWDIGGLSTAEHPQTGDPTIIVHDAIHGGSGCAEQGFLRIESWLQAAFERLSRCPCDTGCPACVQSPKCGNRNEPLSKTGALILAALMCDELGVSPRATAGGPEDG